MLRLRSDEQLVALFRGGNDEAFRVIHDRYRQRLFAYTRQMLPGSGQDAEDALQDVFVRAYASLRANDRNLALRAWLYRVAHNRCVDELRRAPLPTYDVIETSRIPAHDPIVEAEQRETLRRLIEDVRRLPEQQRSALLMRELSGMSYAELAGALCVSVPAVKSLLVRARIGLAKAMEARETACSAIHEELVLAHDRGVRPSGTVRRHLRDCQGCREFRGEVRGLTRQFAALVPALGPAGVLAKLMGIGGGAGAGGGAAGGGGAAIAGGAAGTGGVLTAGGLMATGATHVATLLAAAVITAGGAADLANSIVVPVKHHSLHHAVAGRAAGLTPAAGAPASPATSTSTSSSSSTAAAAGHSGAANVAAANVSPDRASSVAPRHGHPRAAARGDSDTSGDPGLSGSLDQGTFGMPASATPDGAQAPAAGAGTQSGSVSGDGTTAGGTSPGTTGSNGSSSSSTTGSTTGTGPGSPASAGPGAGKSASGTPVSAGPQPIASGSSAGSSSTGGTGGSNTGAPSSGGPSSSAIG